MATTQFDSRTDARSLRGEILDRLPPQSLEAEKAVLGSILLDPDTCDDVATTVREADFYGMPIRSCSATCWPCTRTACGSTSCFWSSG